MEISTAVIALSTTVGVSWGMGTFLVDKGLSNFWIGFSLILYIVLVLILIVWLWGRMKDEQIY